MRPTLNDIHMAKLLVNKYRIKKVLPKTAKFRFAVVTKRGQLVAYWRSARKQGAIHG